MFIIIGLGNPLPKYQKTRHNLGQTVVSCFQEKNNFPEFKFKKKFNCLISEKKTDDQKIILALPQNFINNSGQTVQKIIKNYQPPINNLLVIQDDLALPLGTIRIKTTGSSGGHNGIQSIIEHLKTKDFVRLKIGVANEKTSIVPAEKFVLEKFNKEEKIILPKIIEKAQEIINNFLKNKKTNNRTIVVV